jgi:acetolactate synthase-1/2/3 large subunit
MPLAVGAAVACPDRKVINLQADGSGMYSLQALWTQAREKLDVLTIIFSNSSYAILKHELDNVQAKSGRVALDMMELERPKLDWVSLAEGMGVQACRVETVEQFKSAMSEALRTHQPYLIEAIVP